VLAGRQRAHALLERLHRFIPPERVLAVEDVDVPAGRVHGELSAISLQLSAGIGRQTLVTFSHLIPPTQLTADS
jgi:hypothetical protein